MTGSLIFAPELPDAPAAHGGLSHNHQPLRPKKRPDAHHKPKNKGGKNKGGFKGKRQK
jgi:hypothetical protein